MSDRTVTPQLAHNDDFPFPCILATVLQRTIFFSGPLIPNYWFDPAANTLSGRLRLANKQLPSGEHALKIARIRKKVPGGTNSDWYVCWLCESVNAATESVDNIEQRCNTCNRHRFPSWAMGRCMHQKLPLFPGDVLEIETDCEDQENFECSKRPDDEVKKTDDQQEIALEEGKLDCEGKSSQPDEQKESLEVQADEDSNLKVESEVIANSSQNGQSKLSNNQLETKSFFPSPGNRINATINFLPGLHFITNIDYKREYVETVQFEPNTADSQTTASKPSGGEYFARSVVRARISLEDLTKYKLNIVSDKRALQFRHTLLCGHCGKLNRTNINGSAQEELGQGHHRYCQDILHTPQEIEAIKGKMRQAYIDLEDLQQELNFLRRRWKEQKSRYMELVETDNKCKALRATIDDMAKTIEPIQLWCAHCGWEFGRYKKIMARFRELNPEILT